MPDVVEVQPAADVRKRLPELARRMEHDGLCAQPIVFGPHRKPLAALISYRQLMALMDELEDLRIAEEIRRRDAEDDGTRLTLDEFAEALGVPADDY